MNPPAFGDAHTDFTRCLIIRAWNFRAFTFFKLINPIIGSKDINNNFVKKKKGTRIHISVEATFDYFILCNENPPKKKVMDPHICEMGWKDAKILLAQVQP